MLGSYFHEKFGTVFERAKAFDQISLLYNLISIVDELHQRGIVIGSALADCIFVDEKRVVVEPDENGSKQ